MDSRIEELTEVIMERCLSNLSTFKEWPNAAHTDKSRMRYRIYKEIDGHALSILEALNRYRSTFPEDYK